MRLDVVFVELERALGGGLRLRPLILTWYSPARSASTSADFGSNFSARSSAASAPLTSPSDSRRRASMKS